MKTHPTAPFTTLGMQWNTNTDLIGYRASFDKEKPRITKWTVLSDIALIFDPLGLLASVVMQAKVFVQKLWLKKINWDDEISNELKEEWRNIKNALLRWSNIHVPWWIGYGENNFDVSLHGFCDASEQMYAAACYPRPAHENGVIKSQLITAKTRVAPLKSLIIPRLELCVAVLLANLLHARNKELGIDRLEI